MYDVSRYPARGGGQRTNTNTLKYTHIHYLPKPCQHVMSAYLYVCISPIGKNLPGRYVPTYLPDACTPDLLISIPPSIHPSLHPAERQSERETRQNPVR